MNNESHGAMTSQTWHNGYGPPTDGERIALRILLPTRGSETSPGFIENCATTSLLPRKSIIQLSVHHPNHKVSCRGFLSPSIRVHRHKTHVDIFAHAQYNAQYNIIIIQSVSCSCAINKFSSSTRDYNSTQQIINGRMTNLHSRNGLCI